MIPFKLVDMNTTNLPQEDGNGFDGVLLLHELNIVAPTTGTVIHVKNIQIVVLILSYYPN